MHAALDRAESLVFLDTESTGGRNGRLIEVGLVETDVEQNITGGLHFRCNPHRRSLARARRVHGIQDCELEHCPEFAARADELLEWYGLGARGGHHDAYGDAALLSRVFFELWWDLDEWLYGE